MVVWQFATIAALIGALLIYVMVLTNRLGATNVLLKRIEEGLARPQPVTENLAAGEAEIVPVRAPVLMRRTAVEQRAAAAEVEEEEASAVEAHERERRVSYLTVRDLKVIARPGRRSSDTPVGVSPLFNEVFGRKHAQAERAEALAESPAEAAPHLEVVAVDEPMRASVETPAVVEALAAATHEIRDFLEETPSPTSPGVDPEPVAVEPIAFQPTPTEPAAFERVAIEARPFEPATPEPEAFERVSTEAVTFERTSGKAPTFERVSTEHVAFERAATEPVAFEPAIPEAVTPEPAVYTVEPPPPSPDITAANEDQAPAEEAAAEAPAAAAATNAAATNAAATKSDPDDAAAREEKRKRDLLMHAYRRRRSR